MTGVMINSYYTMFYFIWNIIFWGVLNIMNGLTEGCLWYFRDNLETFRHFHHMTSETLGTNTDFVGLLFMYFQRSSCNAWINEVCIWEEEWWWEEVVVEGGRIGDDTWCEVMGVLACGFSNEWCMYEVTVETWGCHGWSASCSKQHCRLRDEAIGWFDDDDDDDDDDDCNVFIFLEALGSIIWYGNVHWRTSTLWVIECCKWNSTRTTHFLSISCFWHGSNKFK